MEKNDSLRGFYYKGVNVDFKEVHLTNGSIEFDAWVDDDYFGIHGDIESIKKSIDGCIEQGTLIKQGEVK